MRVSVIIPARNAASFINRALDSVGAQTYPVHEVIVAVDTSEDDTASVSARSLASRTGRILINPLGEPWGICGGRNAALKEATGDAILPLDSDDWIEPTYLEKVVPKLVDGVGIVSTHMVYFGDRAGTIVRTTKRTYEQQLKYNNITVTSLVLKKALDEAGEYDHNLRGWEDWDMWLRILKLGYKHDFVPEILFHYHLSNGGMNAWANQNRGRLTEYLVKKHPGFLDIRKKGDIDEDGVFRQKWNDL